jgi:hypothetical protein
VLSRKCDADTLDPAEDPADEHKYWTSKNLQEEPNFTNFEGGAGTWVPPACAVAGDYLYFVWVQAGGTSSHNLRVFATRLALSSDGSSVTWSAPVSLADSGGSPLVMPEKPGHGHTPNTTLAVTAWGDYLIACYNGKNSGGPATWLLVYDTGDWPSQNAPSPWKASGQWSGNLTTWPNFPSSYADLGGQISMDWFTPGGAQKGTASAAPAIYLIISFFNPEKNHAYIWHAMDLTPLDQWDGSQPFKAWEVENRPSPSLGVNVIRDPAGRMRAYSCDSSNDDIQYVVMSTNQVSPDGYSWASFGEDWNLLYGAAGRQSAHQAPVPAFVLGPKTPGQIQVGSDTKQQTVRQVYEFIIYENEGTKLVFSHYGEAVRIADAKILNLNEPVGQGGALKPGEKPKLVVTGVVDSPLPIPAANLEGQSIPPPPPPARQCRLRDDRIGRRSARDELELVGRLHLEGLRDRGRRPRLADLRQCRDGGLDRAFGNDPARHRPHLKHRRGGRRPRRAGQLLSRRRHLPSRRIPFL